MALSLRALAALLENPSLSPSTHVRRLTTDCASSFGGPSILFWIRSLEHHLLPFLHKVAYTQTDTFTNTDKTLQKITRILYAHILVVEIIRSFGIEILFGC